MSIHINKSVLTDERLLVAASRLATSALSLVGPIIALRLASRGELTRDEVAAIARWRGSSYTLPDALIDAGICTVSSSGKLSLDHDAMPWLRYDDAAARMRAKRQAPSRPKRKSNRKPKRDTTQASLPIATTPKPARAAFASTDAEVIPSGGSRRGRADDVTAVVEHYRTYHPRAMPRISLQSKEVRAIHRRLDEGYSVEDLCAAIDGMHRTPHNLGVNERGQKYLGLELCMRSASQVDRFAQVADDWANNGGMPPKIKNSNDLAGEIWLAKYVAREREESNERERNQGARNTHS